MVFYYQLQYSDSMGSIVLILHKAEVMLMERGWEYFGE